MDWGKVLIDSGLLQAVLYVLAIVLAGYLAKAAGAWSKYLQEHTKAAKALKIVKAGWQMLPKEDRDKWTGDLKAKLKSNAVALLMAAIPSLKYDEATIEIENAVQKFKQEGKS